MMNFKVTGIKALKKDLNKLEKELIDAVEQGMLDGADIVKEAAMENSQKGGDDFPHKRTGNLLNDLDTSNPLSKEWKDDEFVVEVGTTVPYGRRLEHGFTGIDSLGRRYNQRPRPFLSPALDENENKIQSAVEKRLKKVVGKYK